ncbi:MAG TPA: pyruvate carboxylase subunit B, partial [Fervidobacterium sp.]|nr:pyruvate carboxylase subunit B [Fervidobacterium sp.]
MISANGFDIFAEQIKGERGKRKKVLVTETVLRDAHQSLMATRMRTKDMLSIAARMDEVGYYSFEMWGGATFDAAMRFLDEDPWERLRALRRVVKKTKLQMLLRGQNLVGYKHYPDDVVREFVKRAVGNGLDIIRVFDALNDLRNMEVAADQVKKEGAHLQLSICYTISPVHTLESFAKLALEMKDMGADSICIKDMAGLLSPVVAYRLVRAIKEKCDLPVHVHTHYTSGMGSMAYLAAVLAGADIIDCAISPFAMGTSQPPTESLVAALKDSIYDTGIELQDLVPIANHFKVVREENKDLIVGLTGVDINVLIYQIPGGMYSNLVSQLKEQNALEKLEEVLREVPKVRREMGYPPLVTPTSQLVGTQATLNVLVGKRWHIVPN